MLKNFAVSVLVVAAMISTILFSGVASAQVDVPDRIAVELSDGADCVVTNLDDCRTVYNCKPSFVRALEESEGVLTYSLSIAFAGSCELFVPTAEVSPVYIVLGPDGNPVILPGASDPVPVPSFTG